MSSRRAAKGCSQLSSRGRERGEIRKDADLELAVDALHGAVFYRLLLSGEVLDDDFASRLADHVLEGLASSPLEE